MSGITSLREKFPQYEDLSDAQLAFGVYQKFYSDMPVSSFSKTLGLDEAQSSELFQSAKNISARNIAPKAYDPNEIIEKPVNKFGDVTSEMMEGPFTSAKQYAGGLRSYVPGGVSPAQASPTYSALPESVPDFLRVPAGAVGDFGMGMLSLLGTGMAGGAGLVGEAIGGDTKDEQRAARDIMGGFEGAVPVIGRATAPISKLSRRVAAGKLPTSRREYGEITSRMEDARIAEDLGVIMPAVTQGTVLPMASKALEMTPLGAGPIGKAGSRAIDQIAENVSNIASKAGDVSSIEGAGARLQSGALQYVSDFKTKSSKMFESVATMIGNDTLVVAPATANVLEEITKDAANFPNMAQHLSLGKYGNLLKDLRDGVDVAVPYSLLKDLRTSYGEALSGKGPLADMSEGKLKRIYSSLSDDMRSAAEASGSKALRSFDRANAYYKGGSDRIKNTLSRILPVEGDPLKVTPASAYNQVSKILLEGNAKQSNTALMAIKNSLSKDDWDAFRATLINRLGHSKPGQSNVSLDDIGTSDFSTADFFKNYNQMENVSRRMVFAGESNKDLADLAKLAKKASDAGLKVSGQTNAASDAGKYITYGTMISGATSLGTGNLKAAAIIGAVLASGAAAGKIISSPMFLKALNKASKNDMGALQKIAQGSSETAVEAKRVLGLLSANQANEAQGPVEQKFDRINQGPQ